MIKFFLLKIPVYIVDEGPEGTVGLFLLALLGFGLFKLGKYMDENVENSCLSSFGEVFVKKAGVALILTGIISGIITLYMIDF